MMQIPNVRFLIEIVRFLSRASNEVQKAAKGAKTVFTFLSPLQSGRGGDIKEQ
jgi:hypothetical protein